MLHKIWVLFMMLTMADAGVIPDANISIVHHSREQMEITIDYTKACYSSINRQSHQVVLTVTCGTSPEHSSTSTTKDKGQPKQPMQNQIVKTAIMKLGAPYQYAHAGPESFDCSGFVYYVYGQNGFAIPRTSKAQSQMPIKLKRSELRKGDILFFDTANRGHVNHSGIYIGKGKFIHASSGKAHRVTVSELDKGFYKDKFRWGTRVEK